MRRLVVALPEISCVRCRAIGTAMLRYVDSGAAGDAPGTAYANMGPPPGWVVLGPTDRIEKVRRTFLICASCYETGAANGSIPTTAIVEEIAP